MVLIRYGDAAAAHLNRIGDRLFDHSLALIPEYSHLTVRIRRGSGCLTRCRAFKFEAVVSVQCQTGCDLLLPSASAAKAHPTRLLRHRGHTILPRPLRAGQPTYKRV